MARVKASPRYDALRAENELVELFQLAYYDEIDHAHYNTRYEYEHEVERCEIAFVNERRPIHVAYDQCCVRFAIVFEFVCGVGDRWQRKYDGAQPEKANYQDGLLFLDETPDLFFVVNVLNYGKNVVFF